MSNKTIIWDFNGTIIDDVGLCVDVMNEIYKENHMDLTMTKEHYVKIFDFPVIKYYQNAGFKLDDGDFERISHHFVDSYQKGFDSIKVSQNIIDALSYAKEMGYRNVIISASKKDILLKQVETLGIGHFFDQIEGINDIYATSKVDVAINWRNANRDDELLVIGDSLHDFEVANAIGATCYLLSDGHIDEKRLKDKHDLVFSNIKEVMLCLE